MNYEDTKKNADYVKKHGIIQFLNLYASHKER